MSLFGDNEQMRSAADANSCKWGYFITQVSDTGEGIQPKVIKNLFSTFNNTKLSMFKSRGAGIGLSTSKELA